MAAYEALPVTFVVMNNRECLSARDGRYHA